MRTNPFSRSIALLVGVSACTKRVHTQQDRSRARENACVFSSQCMVRLGVGVLFRVEEARGTLSWVVE